MGHQAAWTVCGVIAVALNFGPCPARADERSVALVEGFRTFCGQTVPSFGRLDATAKALSLHLESGLAPRDSAGRSIRSKSWSVSDSTGTYALQVSESFKGPIHSVNCGIDAPDAELEEMRRALVTLMNLSQPAAESMANDRSQASMMWRRQIQKDWVTIWLTHAYPNRPGVQLGATVTHVACAPGLKEAVLARPERSNPVSFAGSARVIDAETLDVCGLRVHLEGLAVPGNGDRDGAAAKKALRTIIGVASVRCSDSGFQVPSGVVGMCWVGGGNDIGELLIRAGFAIACPNAPVYEPIEREARAQRAGIWRRDPPPALSCS